MFSSFNDHRRSRSTANEFDPPKLNKLHKRKSRSVPRARLTPNLLPDSKHFISYDKINLPRPDEVNAKFRSQKGSLELSTSIENQADVNLQDHHEVSSPLDENWDFNIQKIENDQQQVLNLEKNFQKMRKTVQNQIAVSSEFFPNNNISRQKSLTFSEETDVKNFAAKLDQQGKKLDENKENLKFKEFLYTIKYQAKETERKEIAENIKKTKIKAKKVSDRELMANLMQQFLVQKISENGSLGPGSGRRLNLKVKKKILEGIRSETLMISGPRKVVKENGVCLCEKCACEYVDKIL